MTNSQTICAFLALFSLTFHNALADGVTPLDKAVLSFADGTTLTGLVTDASAPTTEVHRAITPKALHEIAADEGWSDSASQHLSVAETSADAVAVGDSSSGSVQLSTNAVGCVFTVADIAVGWECTFAKVTPGPVQVQFSPGVTVLNAGHAVSNVTAEAYAAIRLLLVQTNKVICVGSHGTWMTQ